MSSAGAAPAAARRDERAACRPIGVFDSGVGGLTVVAALRERLPDEAILYLGDTARLPYGTKSPATVRRYTERNIGFLVVRGVKAVIVACNTASALALDGLATPVPTAGVIEPGARLAAAVSRGRVGVIATESTTLSNAYPRVLASLRPELEVTALACPLFVPLVEEGWHDDPVAEQVARRYLEPLLARRIDTLILGCTHYPRLAPVLRRVVGPDVVLVDSAAAVAEEAARMLRAAGLAADPAAATADEQRLREHHLCVTDMAARFARIAEAILGPGATLELVDVA